MKTLFYTGLFLFLFSSCLREVEDYSKVVYNDDNNIIEKNEKKELIKLSSGETIVKVGDEYFYSDDIKLSEEQFLSLKNYGILFSKSTYDYNPKKSSSGVPVTPESGMASYDNRISTSFGLTPYVGKFWSMARFKFNKNITPSQERAIRSAIRYIENETNVRFYDATNDPDRHPQHGFVYPNIVFTASNVNNSPVGRIGGNQIVNIHNFTLGTIVHEICHSLGMLHEQCRPDRDKYIDINYQNIISGKEYNFNKINHNYFMLGSFDFESIMCYNSYSFSKNGLPTMTKKDGTTFWERDILSENDKRFLNTFYLPLIKRNDVCLQLDRRMFDQNNNLLSEREIEDIEREINTNRCDYPLR